MLPDEIRSGIDHSVFFKDQRDPSVFPRRFRPVFDVGSLQAGDGFSILTESGLKSGDTLQPHRILMAQLIDPVVRDDGVGESKRPLLQVGASDCQILALRSRGHGFGIRVDGGRVILELCVKPGKHNRPARISRRVFHGFGVVARQLRAQIMFRGKPSRLSQDVLIVGKSIDDLNELVERFLEFPFAHQDRNQTTAHRGDAIGFVCL